MKWGYLAAFALLSGCREKGEVAPPDIKGVYKLSGCPDITVSAKSVSSDGVEAPYDLINIKGYYYIDIDGTLVSSNADGCHIVRDRAQRYIPIYRRDGKKYIKIFSQDLRYAVYYEGAY